jgi:hypothetical protein
MVFCQVPDDSPVYPPGHCGSHSGGKPETGATWLFREDVPFKASYILMSIILFVYVVIMMVAFMMRFDPTTAYIGQFFVGSFLLGRFIEINEESIGIMKGSLVSLLTTAITYGIWFLGGRTIMGMLGLRMARGF